MGSGWVGAVEHVRRNKPWHAPMQHLITVAPPWTVSGLLGVLSKAEDAWGSRHGLSSEYTSGFSTARPPRQTAAFPAAASAKTAPERMSGCAGPQMEVGLKALT
jgi:hypothetical protein